MSRPLVFAGGFGLGITTALLIVTVVVRILGRAILP